MSFPERPEWQSSLCERAIVRVCLAARHLVSLYYRSKEEEMSEALDISLLRDYITYAKAHYNPKYATSLLTGLSSLVRVARST